MKNKLLFWLLVLSFIETDCLDFTETHKLENIAYQLQNNISPENINVDDFFLTYKKMCRVVVYSEYPVVELLVKKGANLGNILATELPEDHNPSNPIYLEFAKCTSILQIALCREQEIKKKAQWHSGKELEKMQKIIEFLKEHFEYLKCAKSEVHSVLDKQNQDDSGYAPGFLPSPVVNIVNEYL